MMGLGDAVKRECLAAVPSGRSDHSYLHVSACKILSYFIMSVTKNVANDLFCASYRCRCIFFMKT